MKIGLLGGSFNPAHEGHLHISEIALKKLKLSQVWWLVSPQNPLKNKVGKYPERLAQAKKIVGSNPRIVVSDIENKIGTVYTVDTLKRLKQKFPSYDFVWLMGADNLIQLPRWKRWQEIVKLVPIHVFDRAEFLYQAINGLAYKKYQSRITYHKIRKHNAASSEIRARQG